MSKAEDINTLYKRFGGNAGTYQEIGASEMAGAAAQRWPLLGELRPQGHREAPSATKGGVPVGDRQVRSFMVPPAQRSMPAEPPQEPQPSSFATQPSPPQHAAPVAEPVQPAPVRRHQEDVPASPVPVTQAKAPAAGSPSRRPLFGGSRDSQPEQPARAEPTPVPPSQWLAAKPSAPVVAAKPASKAPAKSRKVKEEVAAVEPIAAPKKRPAAKKAAASSKKRDEIAQEEASLQSVFNRLVPPKPEAPAPVAAPLKKLVKW